MSGFDPAIGDALRLLAAFLLAIPLGWDRENETRNHGIRTYPLVAMGSAAYALAAGAFLEPTSDAHARIIQGLITGIGFLGAGAIMRDDDHVKGSATAASVWCTAAVGVAVAHGRWTVAVTTVVLGFIALRWLKALKKPNGPDDQEAESSR